MKRNTIYWGKFRGFQRKAINCTSCRITKYLFFVKVSFSIAAAQISTSLFASFLFFLQIKSQTHWIFLSQCLPYLAQLLLCCFYLLNLSATTKNLFSYFYVFFTPIHLIIFWNSLSPFQTYYSSFSTMIASWLKCTQMIKGK